jgi:hypothetical protein
MSLHGHKIVSIRFGLESFEELKFMENQKKFQLQTLFQITPYFSINFLGIFLTP